MSTAIGMPAYYEYDMLLSRSPQATFLADYSPNFLFYEPPRASFRPQTPPQCRKNPGLTLKMPTMPIRPCLVVKPDDDVEPDQQSPTKLKSKKKVVFADDNGKELVHVRVMTEPSYLPPSWSLNFLAQVTQGLISPVTPEQWTVEFRQPASDYIEFRRKLDSQFVCLENVIVKENESIVVGTIKVRNVSFQKEVIVRTSWDDWKSQEDVFCTYNTIGAGSGAYILYDTFSFKITLPPASRKLEFCVCYRYDNIEHWDNNNNKNYLLTKKGSMDSKEMPNLKPIERVDPIQNKYSCSIYTQEAAAKHTWSDYAAWNNPTETSASPYW